MYVNYLAPVMDLKKPAVWAATPREAGWISSVMSHDQFIKSFKSTSELLRPVFAAPVRHLRSRRGRRGRGGSSQYRCHFDLRHFGCWLSTTRPFDFSLCMSLQSLYRVFTESLQSLYRVFLVFTLHIIYSCFFSVCFRPWFSHLMMSLCTGIQNQDLDNYLWRNLGKDLAHCTVKSELTSTRHRANTKIMQTFDAYTTVIRSFECWRASPTSGDPAS